MHTMDASVTDPLQRDFPEVIETYLEHGIMKCIAFNRRGTLLAAGCSDGSCVIWDFQTRGIAKELKNENCVFAITSVSWSRNGHHILVSAADNSLTLWNVLKGEKVFQTTLQHTPVQAHLHPGSSGGLSPPSLCLVSSSSSAPFILDFHTKIITMLPISSPDNGTHNNVSDESAHYTPTAACFNKSGDLVYLGSSIGEILIINYRNNKICGIVQIPGGAAIKNMVLSRNGQHLLTNSSDRIIRVYENLLPLKDPHKSFEVNEICEMEKLKSVGLRCLSLFREFQDSITKVPWRALCFSGDSEWVVGGSACKGEHKIYIWDRDGLLVKLLEGPKEALVDLAWHPVQPIVVSVSLTGLVYIWVKDYTENWSAFAPDFRELEENEEYVEREDEFDLNPDIDEVKESRLNEDDEVDIVTVEKDSTFSDSDLSQEELCYLPVDPCPDSPVILIESNNFGSSLSNEGEAHLKRKRKRSRKLLELQDLSDTWIAKATGLSYMQSFSAPVKKPEPASKDDTRSIVWNHFTKVNEPNKKAVGICNYCAASFVVENAGTSNLRSHLRKEHAESIFPEDFADIVKVSTTDDDSEYEEVKPRTERKRSEVWNYFKKFNKPNSGNVAVCNFCHQTFVAGAAVGTNHLWNHVKRKHAEEAGINVSTPT